MKYKIFEQFILGLLCTVLFFGFAKKEPVAPDFISTNTIDTSQFAANATAGWSIYDAYFHQDGQDSVTFELILQHAPVGNWRTEQFVGIISQQDFIPAVQQEVDYFLLLDRWRIRINIDGKVYIKLAAGFIPPGNPVIIPFRVRFKRTN